jgi:hypothetical protein
MPIKRVAGYVSSSTEIKEIALKEIEKYQHSKSTTSPSCYIIVIIIFFLIGVTFEVLDTMEEKFTVTDSQAKSCMMEFQTKQCSPLKLEGECASIYSCIQKEEKEGIVTKSSSFLIFYYEEVKENIFIPASLIVSLLLYQIAKSMKNREEVEVKRIE